MNRQPNMGAAGMKFLGLLVCASFFCAALSAQSLTQTIRGQVTEISTGAPIPFASVFLEGTGMGSTTDTLGQFRIVRVPVGRYNVVSSFVGYENGYAADVVVTSGKEVVLQITMQESGFALDEVVVKASIRKDAALNPMATVSARTFSVEETQRYAGGFNDPARMVSAYAGVTTGNIQDNAIVIRGNSPKGVLWRVEGVDVPNPNHFPNANVAGGGVLGILNSTMLANSDFYTGAFPAEYSNAMAGVFDMKMRSGNNQKHEHSVELGTMGISVASEGPFSKNSDANYLLNYRYSTLGLLIGAGVIDTKEKITYQDLSLKVNLPTKHAGTFSLWGFGGIDKLANEPLEKDDWETDWDRTRLEAKWHTGAAGLNHRYRLAGNSTYINTSLTASAAKMILDQHRLDDSLVMQKDDMFDNLNYMYSLNSYVNHTFNPQLTIKGGIAMHEMRYEMRLGAPINNDPSQYAIFVDDDGRTMLSQVYVQAKYAMLPTLTLNAGVNANFFALSTDLSLEPRAALQWKALPRHSFSLGYGRHSQTEELNFYLLKNNGTQPNMNLKMTRADHFVLSYDWSISQYLRLKVEPYYQQLSKVPIVAGTTFSMINFKRTEYFSDVLVNKGKGYNAGVDVTLERFMKNNFYYLITGSLFESKYKNDDNVWRNSRYNKGYAINILVGKEFYYKNKVFGFNGRISYTGGEYDTPILREESIAAQEIIYDESMAFTQKLAANCNADIGFTYRANYKKFASVLSLQIKNVLGTPLEQGYSYNFKTNDITKDKMVVILPNLSYRIEF